MLKRIALNKDCSIRAFIAATAVLLLGLSTAPSCASDETNDIPESAPPAAAPGAGARRIEANPSNYLQKLKHLRPGDTLVLQSGVYDDPEDVPGLPIFDLHGKPGRPIVITGPDHGPRPELHARPTHNTIRIADSSYVVIRNLVLEGRGAGVDGVKAQGISHHITLENLLIRNHGGHQQVVGISAKAPAWGWIVRRNVIIGAGTGMYFGHPNGSWPFVGGLIENNVILDTIGYNIEIKHQKTREAIPEMPVSRNTTIIRHNVFSKRNDGATGKWARPNLLVGHFPRSGPGADDFYQIYGNFFFENPTGECLFQGEGNIALYDNVFVNRRGDAVCIRPHNGTPRQVFVFHNTIAASGIGIELRGGDPACTQKVAGNAVFASVPILAAVQADNVTDSFPAADKYLVNPAGEPGAFDPFPKPGALTGKPIDIPALRHFTEAALDFNGRPHDPGDRGAYSGASKNPGWLPAADVKPLSSTVATVPEATPVCLEAAAN